MNLMIALLLLFSNLSANAQSADELETGLNAESKTEQTAAPPADKTKETKTPDKEGQEPKEEGQLAPIGRMEKPRKRMKKEALAGHKKFFIVLGADYDMASTGSFPTVKVTTTSGLGTTLEGTAVVHANNGVGFHAGVLWARPHSWGLEGLFTFELPRKIKEVSFGGDLTGAQATTEDSINLIVLQAGTLFRWDAFYLPFGLNYIIPKYKVASGTAASIEATGGLGFQVGSGFIINDILNLEALWIFETMRLKSTTATVNTDYGTGIITGPLLRLGVAF